MTVNEKIDYLFSKINWKDSALDGTAISIMNTLKNDIQQDSEYNMAIHQFIGYKSCKNGETIINLSESMGLTLDEFIWIEDDLTMSQSEKQELKNYLNGKK